MWWVNHKCSLLFIHHGKVCTFSPPWKATLARAPSKSHGDPSPWVKRKVAPPGTHGRTDMALVRQVLGPTRFMPEGYHIRWDGLRKRWLGSFRHKTLPGTNAVSSRFTDEGAIEHIYEVCTKHAAHWPELPWNPWNLRRSRFQGRWCPRGGVVPAFLKRGWMPCVFLNL